MGFILGGEEGFWHDLEWSGDKEEAALEVSSCSVDFENTVDCPVVLAVEDTDNHTVLSPVLPYDARIMGAAMSR